jgi:hypothetical protein
MASMEPSGTVTFTTKELILQMDAKLDTLVQLVASKAENSSLVALELRLQALEANREHRDKHAHDMANRVTVLDGKIARLETQEARQEAVAQYRKWILAGGGITGILVLLNVVSTLKDFAGG